MVSTTIATKTEKDDEDPERRNIVDTSVKKWNLIGRNNELFFPPTAMADQGIALPHSALLKYPTIQYSKTFKSQERTISINLTLGVDEVIEEQEQLKRQNRPQNFEVSPGVIAKNLGYFVLDNDVLVKQLADIITKGFKTKREKLQAILDFIHSYNYVPDAYGEAPRTPRISLISKGGDCEDSTILVVALAQAVRIDSVFMYFNEHAAAACDIGEEGTAFKWDGKLYEWCETTGGDQGVVTVTNFVDPVTYKTVRSTKSARGWKIGEKPEGIGPITHVSRVNSDRLTSF